MTTVWKSTDVAKALNASVSGAWEATRISIDSRTVQPGDIYVALKGERLDGHDFIAEALTKGAVAAIGEYGDDARIIKVPNSYRALEQLGAFARARFKGRVIGLTGSVGKTTTKEMLRAALSAHGETFASHGNFNNHIGTPLNLANLPENAAFGVFEKGMNHAGEISALTKQVRPHVALITNVEAVHLEFFKSLDAIADAKAEIFEGLEPGGIAILNADNAQYTRLKTRPHLSVGKSGDVKLLALSYSANGMKVEASVAGTPVGYTMQAIGEHVAMASLFALATAHALKLDIQKTAIALAGFSEISGRGSVKQITKDGLTFWLLDDAYNASPASMAAAFKKTAALRQMQSGIKRVVAVLGDMLELGGSEAALHAGLAKPIQEAGIDLVITAGSRMEHLHNALPNHFKGDHVVSAEALKLTLLKALGPNDLVLVKGSHGSKMYEIATYLEG